MRRALRYMGFALDAFHLGLAAAVILLPEARGPFAAEALRVMMHVNGVRLVWGGWRAGILTVPVSRVHGMRHAYQPILPTAAAMCANFLAGLVLP